MKSYGEFHFSINSWPKFLIMSRREQSDDCNNRTRIICMLTISLTLQNFKKFRKSAWRVPLPPVTPCCHGNSDDHSDQRVVLHKWVV